MQPSNLDYEDRGTIVSRVGTAPDLAPVPQLMAQLGLPRFLARPKLIGQWKFDRGFRSILAAMTRIEALSHDLEKGKIDAERAICDLYRRRHQVQSAISYLAESPLRDAPQAWRHVREGVHEADECLSYAIESLEYEEVQSAATDLQRVLEALRMVLFTIRTRSTLRYRSWPLDPWRLVARRFTPTKTASLS